jgi:hypothetical protein
MAHRPAGAPRSRRRPARSPSAPAPRRGRCRRSRRGARRFGVAERRWPRRGTRGARALDRGSGRLELRSASGTSQRVAHASSLRAVPLSFAFAVICANLRNLWTGRCPWPGFCRTNPIGPRRRPTRDCETNPIRQTLLSAKWIRRGREGALLPLRWPRFPAHPWQSAVIRACPPDVWRVPSNPPLPSPSVCADLCPSVAHNSACRSPRPSARASASALAVICANLRHLRIPPLSVAGSLRNEPNTSERVVCEADTIRPRGQTYGSSVPAFPGRNLRKSASSVDRVVVCGWPSAKRTQWAYGIAGQRNTTPLSCLLFDN